MSRDGSSSDHYAWPVVVHGNDASVDQIRAALSSSPSILLAEPPLDLCSNAHGLVVCLDGIPASSKELELIGQFHSARGRVICIVPGLHKVSLAEQCKLLLAGADALLDESEDNYLANLLSTIETLAREETLQFAEWQRIRKLMNEAGIAGRSQALIEIFGLVERIATFSDLPVLITGETGTGKELFAQAIHSLDPRRKSTPFIAINCASLPDSLSESELFGFKRGAFTGADRDRLGLFRAAHRGVLFLDEIGELSMATQTKLLRVLQNGCVLPIGDDREMKVDVRIIAATNRNLEEMVRERQFREDLYHRINVLRISLPPLRDRPEDIELLVEHFIRKYSSPTGTAPAVFTAQFISVLQKSALPGNVRQLENLIRKASLLTNGRRALSLHDLPKELLRELVSAHDANIPEPLPEASLRTIAMQFLEKNGWSLVRSLEQFEHELLVVALEAAGGNQSEAARKLGITSRSVYNKLHRSRPA